MKKSENENVGREEIYSDVEILGVKLKFTGFNISELIVYGTLYGSELVCVAGTKNLSGYLHLKPYDIPSYNLFVKCLKFGRKLNMTESKKQFPEFK